LEVRVVLRGDPAVNLRLIQRLRGRQGDLPRLWDLIAAHLPVPIAAEIAWEAETAADGDTLQVITRVLEEYLEKAEAPPAAHLRDGDALRVITRVSEAYLEKTSPVPGISAAVAEEAQKAASERGWSAARVWQTALGRWLRGHRRWLCRQARRATG
jgi:hypothetical protein